MNSTAEFSSTDIAQAKLVSKLSSAPARVSGDVFVWNDVLIDRASAVVALLKINNQVPVRDSVKVRLYQNYQKRFGDQKNTIFLNTDETDDSTLACVWFHRLCSKVKSAEPLGKDSVKQMLIILHTE